MKLTLLPTSAVDAFWPLLSSGFQHACIRSGTCNLNAGILWQLVRSGQAFLIISHKGEEIYQASIWQFDPVDESDQRSGAALRCLMLYGKNIKLWYGPMLELITKLGLENGASRLVTTGRHGWLRQCSGAVKFNNDYEVELTHGRWWTKE